MGVGLIYCWHRRLLASTWWLGGHEPRRRCATPLVWFFFFFFQRHKNAALTSCRSGVAGSWKFRPWDQLSIRIRGYYFICLRRAQRKGLKGRKNCQWREEPSIIRYTTETFGRKKKIKSALKKKKKNNLILCLSIQMFLYVLFFGSRSFLPFFREIKQITYGKFLRNFKNNLKALCWIFTCPAGKSVPALADFHSKEQKWKQQGSF